MQNVILATFVDMEGGIRQMLSPLKKASYKAMIANMGKAVFSSGIVTSTKPIVVTVLAKSAIANALSVIIGVGAVMARIPAACCFGVPRLRVIYAAEKAWC